MPLQFGLKLLMKQQVHRFALEPARRDMIYRRRKWPGSLVFREDNCVFELCKSVKWSIGIDSGSHDNRLVHLQWE